MARLATEIWVQAYLKRLGLEGIPAYVTAHGDATGGAVIVKLARLDGTAVAFSRVPDLMTGERRWETLAEGPEPEVDAALTRQKGFDPDLWVIGVEDRKGRHLLDEEGLA